MPQVWYIKDNKNIKDNCSSKRKPSGFTDFTLNATLFPKLSNEWFLRVSPLVDPLKKKKKDQIEKNIYIKWIGKIIYIYIFFHKNTIMTIKSRVIILPLKKMLVTPQFFYLRK